MERLEKVSASDIKHRRLSVDVLTILSDLDFEPQKTPHRHNVHLG